MATGSRIILAYDSYTAIDGSGLSNHVADVGGIALENGIGCWAAGASIQSNEAKRTSNGSGGETLHNYLPGLLNDKPGAEAVEICYKLGRPNDSTNHRFGFFLRGDGGQFGGATADQIIVYLDRVDDNNVALKVRCTENTVLRQQVTVTASYAWAKNIKQVLGCSLAGDQLQVWTEDTLDGTRTLQGTAVTLSTTLNDSSHKCVGPWIQLGISTGFTWDDLRVSYLNTLPTAPVAFTTPTLGALAGHPSYTVEWTAATDADSHSLQYEGQYSLDSGENWSSLFTLQAGLTYAWDTTGIAEESAALVRVRAHDGYDYGPYLTSSAFTVGSVPSAPSYVKVS